MDKRIGVVGIIVKNRHASAPKVNQILSSFGDMMVGRVGVPCKDKGVNVIGIIIEASTDQVGAMTGKLGQLEGVQVKSILV